MLNIAELELELNFYTSIHLDYWLGSAFRGGFGRYLKMVCCTAKVPECFPCKYKYDCIYFYVYENTSSSRGYSSPVKPIIFIPPFFGKKLIYDHGINYSLKVLMFERFDKFLPYIIHGLNYLGKAGLGSVRYENINKFYLNKITCGYSGDQVYDGEAIYFDKLITYDINKIEPYKGNELAINFQTPYIGEDFPLTFDRFLKKIKNRLILFLNQYGNRYQIPNFIAEGKILDYTRHKHILKRKSIRTGRQTFQGYTGIIKYELEEVDAVGRWLINVGSTLGLGPDSSFGLGFIQQIKPENISSELMNRNQLNYLNDVTD